MLGQATSLLHKFCPIRGVATLANKAICQGSASHWSAVSLSLVVRNISCNWNLMIVAIMATFPAQGVGCPGPLKLDPPGESPFNSAKETIPGTGAVLI